MNAYICPKCGRTSYSAASLEHHKNPSCPYCGYDMRKPIEKEKKNDKA